MAGVTAFILDTSVYSAFNRGNQEVKRWFHSRFQIYLPLIVLGELRAGFAAGSRTQENEGLLRRFLDAPNVSLLPLSAVTTEHFASLFLKLRQRGIALSTNDLWIAAQAREHNLPLLSLDEDFMRIPDIKVLPKKQ